jgi:hypothetical protein
MAEQMPDRRTSGLARALATLGLMGLAAALRFVARRLPTTTSQAATPLWSEAENGGQPTVRHERSDLRFRGIAILLAAILAVGVTQFFLVLRLFHYHATSQAEEKRSPNPPVAARLPPEPRLEQLDRLAGEASSDTEKRLAAAERTLNGFGPTGEQGFVHVPIAAAIDTVAGHLPVRKTPRDQLRKASGLVDAGASDSGRLFEGATR